MPDLQPNRLVSSHDAILVCIELTILLTIGSNTYHDNINVMLILLQIIIIIALSLHPVTGSDKTTLPAFNILCVGTHQ